MKNALALHRRNMLGVRKADEVIQVEIGGRLHGVRAGFVTLACDIVRRLRSSRSFPLR